MCAREGETFSEGERFKHKTYKVFNFNTQYSLHFNGFWTINVHVICTTKNNNNDTHTHTQIKKKRIQCVLIWRLHFFPFIPVRFFFFSSAHWEYEKKNSSILLYTLTVHFWDFFPLFSSSNAIVVNAQFFPLYLYISFLQNTHVFSKHLPHLSPMYHYNHQLHQHKSAIRKNRTEQNRT